ncbi:hypothetical protein BX600DRAFT_473230 [Xylariales sp. PMI_506]|nr:hypothetical protein BX600DRAFT_473230 [Xylariales sp. PMI_506]
MKSRQLLSYSSKLRPIVDLVKCFTYRSLLLERKQFSSLEPCGRWFNFCCTKGARRLAPSPVSCCDETPRYHSWHALLETAWRLGRLARHSSRNLSHAQSPPMMDQFRDKWQVKSRRCDKNKKLGSEESSPLVQSPPPPFMNRCMHAQGKDDMNWHGSRTADLQPVAPGRMNQFDTGNDEIGRQGSERWGRRRKGLGRMVSAEN